MPKFFVHCGLHKTGTSALQEFLFHHSETLANAGMLYPKAGRPESPGHHNIAWELTRDRRFTPGAGGLKALAAEIAGFDGDVLLSSEDFEGLLLQPERLGPLTQVASESGRSVVFIIYLRNQADYLASLYHQCLELGFGEEYVGFLREVVEQGAVRRNEWVFLFDFAKALDRLSAVEGCEVRVRNFHALEHGSVICDFLATVGLPESLFPAPHLTHRTNERSSLSVSLQRFYRNRAQRPPFEQEEAAMTLMGESLHTASTPLPAEAQLANAFVLSNKRLCDRFSLPQDGLVRDVAAERARGDANLAKLFSLDTQVTIAQIAALLQRDGPEKARDPDSAAGRRLRAWSTWLATP